MYCEDVANGVHVPLIDAMQKKICVVRGMVTAKTYLHAPNPVFYQAQPFVDQESIELIESLK